MAAAQFNTCSEEFRLILDNFAFRADDFWEGYKLYCFAHYGHCNASKEDFEASKMGQVLCLFQNTTHVAWGARFDEAIRDAWAMMEEYVQVRHGKDCRNLRALMEEFEDAEQLSTSENGRLLLQLVEDDAYGTERLHRESLAIQVDTDIFAQVRARLNRAGANLANLRPRPYPLRRRRR